MRRSLQLSNSIRAALAAALLTTAVPAGAAPAAPSDGEAGGSVAGDLGPVQVNGSRFAPGTAAYEAASSAPLEAIEPTSVIDQRWIENNTALTSNYDDVISVAPSVYSVSPNGPGLMENQILAIRGFTDGQFNVTFDGIPFQDANDFTHHTTSYFMDHDLGTVAVDRGPGTAATIGNATFGGTVSVQSKGAADVTRVTPYASIGSFATQVYGLQFDTGKLDKLHGGSGFIDAEILSSDGYLHNLGQQRRNIFAKFSAPLGDQSTLTFVAMYNQLHQNFSFGATAAQIAADPRTALSLDPTNQNDKAYNFDKINTDFEYIGLQSSLGDGWTLDNKVYTYAYFHNGDNGNDPNGEAPNGTAFGPNNVPGQVLAANNYRSWGDTLSVGKDFGVGTLKLGAWADKQYNNRLLYEADLTLGGAINAGPPNFQTNPNPLYNGIDRELYQVLTTLQPYAQFDWKVTPALTLSPGVRYDHFERAVDASVNIKTALPQSYTNTFSSTLPSLIAHYMLTPQWSAYAQAAKGFLAPNENFFNHNNPADTTFSPQRTTNYQLGTSWQSPGAALGIDVYDVDFKNLIVTNPAVSGNVDYTNLGGATYKGVEAEGSVKVGAGVTLFANGSVNSAKDKQTGQWLPQAPKATAAAGLVYSSSEWYASVKGKWVGSSYGDVGQTQPIASYGIVDASLAYTVAKSSAWLPDAKLGLTVGNIADSHKIFALAGYTAGAGTPLYWTIPGRSFFVSISVPY